MSNGYLRPFMWLEFRNSREKIWYLEISEDKISRHVQNFLAQWILV